MTNLFEMTADGKKPYSKPMIEVISLEGESIICASTEPYGEGEFSWT